MNVLHGYHKQVCDFIERRDGHRADPDNIFLTNGASEAVRLVLRTAIRGPSDGVMVPVPQVCFYVTRKECVCCTNRCLTQRPERAR